MMLSPLFTMGQQTEILSSSNLNAQVDINLAKGEVLDVTSSDGLRIDVQNSEISIQYTLPELGEEGRFYEVIPIIKLYDEELLLVPHDEFRGDWGQVNSVGEKKIVWINLQSKYIQLEGRLKVMLTIHRWGEKMLPYDCSLGKPQFTSKQRTPFYLAAGIGVASIGLGQLFRSQSQSIYNDEYLVSSTLEEASPKYEDANKNHHTYLLLTYIGAGILATDVTLFLFRQRKYKRNKSLYDQYCTESDLVMAPSLNLSTGVVDGGAGLKLKMNF